MGIQRRSLLKAGAFGLSGMAVGGMLTACAEDEGSAGQAPEATSQGGEAAVTSITVATAATPWLGGYQEIIAEYEEATGVKVTLRDFPFDGLLTQQINAIQQESNAFDVFQINEGWVGQFYGQGWLTPLNQIDSGFEWDEGIADFDGLARWDAERQVTSPDGEVVALPLNGNIHVLAYRKDVYEELGLTPPATWDEAIANGKAAMEAGLTKYGYVTRGQGAPGGYSVTFDFASVLHSFGGGWVKDPGTDWSSAVATSEGQAAMEKYLELLELGPANPQTIDQASVIAAMQSGDALQGHMVVAVAPQLEDPDKSAVAGNIGYAPVPAGPVGRRPVSGAWTFGVPAGLPMERAKAALHFMQWVTGKEAQTSWASKGGIITRADVLDEVGPDQPHLAAMRDSLPDVHQGIRFVFGQSVLESAEVNLNRIVAGQATVDDGLQAIADDIEAAVAEAGLGE